MKKIISWNVASIRARMDTLLRLLDEQKPDVLFLQEIKVEEDKFPFMELQAAGYYAVVSGQKAWNGVAILSKEPIKFISSVLIISSVSFVSWIKGVSFFCSILVLIFSVSDFFAFVLV